VGFQHEDEDGDIQYRRSIPQNELDMNMQLTEPAWGKKETLAQLKNVKLKNALSILSNVFTRDSRLANYDEREIAVVRYYIDLGSDIITEGFRAGMEDIMYEPFTVCLSKGAVISETSQGKKGFLRRMNTTFTNINVKRGTDEPAKKSLFSGKEKGEY